MAPQQAKRRVGEIPDRIQILNAFLDRGDIGCQRLDWRQWRTCISTCIGGHTGPLRLVMFIGTSRVEAGLLRPLTMADLVGYIILDRPAFIRVLGTPGITDMLQSRVARESDVHPVPVAFRDRRRVEPHGERLGSGQDGGQAGRVVAGGPALVYAADPVFGLGRQIALPLTRSIASGIGVILRGRILSPGIVLPARLFGGGKSHPIIPGHEADGGELPGPVGQDRDQFFCGGLGCIYPPGASAVR